MFSNTTTSSYHKFIQWYPRRCCSSLHVTCFWVSLLSLSSLSARKSYSYAWNFNIGTKSGSHKSRPIELQLQLLDKAAQVREKLGPPSTFTNNNNLEQRLFFPSSYQRGGNRNHQQRGFCNWLIPNYIMVGQYPGQTPEVDGPTLEEVDLHLDAMIHDANIQLFCSLQSEVPSQNDDVTWQQKNEGMIFLEPDYVRRQFPRPFTHYAPLVRQKYKHKQEAKEPIFLHSPIQDLNVPESQEPLQKLLLALLDSLSLQQEENSNGSAIYIHCWGGRGRAGLVGGCLLSLIWPSLTASEILTWIQTGYASRIGHEQMPKGLSQSPQTSTQRAFVQQFVVEYQRQLNQQ